MEKYAGKTWQTGKDFQRENNAEPMLLTVKSPQKLFPYDVNATIQSFFLWNKEPGQDNDVFRWRYVGIIVLTQREKGQRSTVTAQGQSPIQIQVKCKINDITPRHQTLFQEKKSKKTKDV